MIKLFTMRHTAWVGAKVNKSSSNGKMPAVVTSYNFRTPKSAFYHNEVWKDKPVVNQCKIAFKLFFISICSSILTDTYSHSQIIVQKSSKASQHFRYQLFRNCGMYPSVSFRHVRNFKTDSAFDQHKYIQMNIHIICTL